MLSLILLTTLALDAPDFAACEAPPWQTATSNLDLLVQDHALGSFHGHEARVRICAAYSGFGYWRIAAVIWVAQDDGSFTASHLDLSMSACFDSSTRRSGDRVVIEHATCAYSDDPDDTPPRTKTRLRWHDDPPRLAPT